MNTTAHTPAAANATHAVPVILMVSGGSDSTALLELAALAASGGEPCGKAGQCLMARLEDCIDLYGVQLHCLHINHLLRGEAADGDEAFVRALCERLGVAFHVRRIDVAALAAAGSAGMEATAREQRYLAASELAQTLSVSTACAAEDVRILTAHTLDDRVETFLMRALVGTGPGGLGSIPRQRGAILRPLLDVTRQELRDFLAEEHPGTPASELWREDATNDDGSNFRSRVRTQLMPIMRQLQPGFERNLARSMDLIAEEDAALQSQAASIVYRNFRWNEDGSASLPAFALLSENRPMARRVLRQSLLLVEPNARLEAQQIERVIDAVFKREERFATDVDSGVRVQLADGELGFTKASYGD